MKIFFLHKRQYMQKDVIDDCYARLYELPNQLARQGHQVMGLCLSYFKREEGVSLHYQEQAGSLEWRSINLGMFIILGLSRYIKTVFPLIKSFKPDVILGSSDCPMVILAALFSRLTSTPYFIDLYDNYESFGLAKIPGILPLYRWAIKGAKGVCCVSEPLSAYIRQRYGHDNVITIESTIKGGDFYPQDKITARTAFNLPINPKILGVAGSLNKERGIGLLYQSFLKLADKYSHLHLALAGPVDTKAPIPVHPQIHYLGLLPHESVSDFYSALDLAVVCMRDTEFGRYAFPQKTYEILACKTPIVTARLGALGEVFKDYPQCLYEPDNQADLEDKIECLLLNPQVIDIPIPTWRDQAVKLLDWIKLSVQ